MGTGDPGKFAGCSLVPDCGVSYDCRQVTIQSSQIQAPPPVAILTKVDNAIGFFEQGILVLALSCLIGVGTFQFVANVFASHPTWPLASRFPVYPTWPFEVLRNLVFVIAMSGAALASQKQRMFTMDFLVRKLSHRNRLLLGVPITCFVVFACYLLYKGGIAVRAIALGDHYEVVNPQYSLLALPVGAALIAIHYILHTASDMSYLIAGTLPPEEEGPQAH